MVWSALLPFGSIISCAAAAVAAQHPTGLPSCPCVEWANLGSNIKGGFLIVKPVGTETSYQYPSTYGQVKCAAHDHGLPPFCNGKNPAAWCDQPWCYVQKTCKGVVKMSTSTIGLEQAYSSAGIMWSFATCAQSNAYIKLSAKSNTAVQSLLDVMESYLRSSRTIIESGYDSIVKGLAVNGSAAPGSGVGGAVSAAARSSAVGCPYNDMCKCTTCKQYPSWNAKLEFESTGVWMKNSITGASKNTFTCLAKGTANVFQKVATKESDPARTHPGYLYFGDQANGGYVQWPNQQQDAMCNGQSYDPRFRPWYAGSVTGPKDIILVVDVSGSMVTAGRHALARKAVKAIIDTLTWKDFAVVVLFNHMVNDKSSDLLKPMTAGNRAAVQKWATTAEWKSGGTKFGNALTKTFDLIEASVKAGETSMCEKIIMFLTDGEDDSFKEDNYKFVKAQSKKFGVSILTYALGSGADTSKAKRLACENGGIFYQIPDNADLSGIMASYYEFISAGQEMCLPSYVKYTSVGPGSELYAGCIPSYHRNDSTKSILGVACMDLNILAPPADLKQQASWKHLVCKMSDQTKICRPFHLDECQREKLRLKIGSYSVCGNIQGVPASKCGCFDRNCQDDMNFIDSQKYFCDVWVGDDCDEAASKWGYTAAQEIEIKAKCKKSCGKCPWKNPCPYKTAKDCLEQAKLPAKCRACTGKVSGVDLEGKPAVAGCSDSSNPRYGCCTGQATASGGTAQATPSSDSDGGGMGLIIFAVVGGVGLIMGVCGVVGFVFCKRKSKPKVPAPVGPVAATVIAAATPAPAVNVNAPKPTGQQLTDIIVPPDKAALVVPKNVPSSWLNSDLTAGFQTITGTDAAVVAMLQSMVNDTWIAKATRDRKDGPMAKSLKVQMVQRIENSKLWSEYCNARACIKGKRVHKCTSIQARDKIQTMQKPHPILAGVDAGVNEVYLWHGTSPGAAAAIAKTGFNINLAGSKTGTMYGNAVYFAECSSKSDEYAKTDQESLYPDTYCLLLCRVVLGETLTMGAGGAGIHSVVDAAMEGGAFESVLGDRAVAVGTYREFMVYTGIQMYPEYVVLYKRES